MRYASRTARRYARALFALADEQGVLEASVAEFHEVVATIEEHSELAAALRRMELPVPRKLAILEAIFRAPAGESDEPPLSELVYHFLCLIIRNGRAALLGEIDTALGELLDARLGIVRARVTTAVPLLKAECEMIVAKLAQLTGAKTVELEPVVSKAVIGGVVIHLGQHVIDASVRTYLDTMRERLKRVKVAALSQQSMLTLDYDRIREAARASDGPRP